MKDGKREDVEKNGKKKKLNKKKQKLKNGIELDADAQSTGCGDAMPGCTEPENIREIISKDEATTGSRWDFQYLLLEVNLTNIWAAFLCESVMFSF